jgi:hypothetical protein
MVTSHQQQRGVIVKQYRIDELLANGEQWFEDLDTETFESLVAALNAHTPDSPMTVPVVLSERGRLLDGHQRLMALQRLGRKVITERDVRIDHKAKDDESEAVASISYQFRRRQLGTAEKAKLARDLMARFRWSQGTIARQLGVSRPAVTQWLTAHPDPDFTPPTTIRGEDGRDYTLDPEPKVKRPPRKGPAMTEVVDEYARQLANPAWGQWLTGWAVTAPAEERDAVVASLLDIARATAMLAEHLSSAAIEGDDEESF